MHQDGGKGRILHNFVEISRQHNLEIFSIIRKGDHTDYISTTTMSRSRHPSLHTLPIESVYHILDHLEPFDILVSMRNVCSRLNAITDTYQPYTVNIVMT